ncbi:hypothetical protein C8R44DRAFT_731306 [Mycena epipterygia]|nr:hypothetical protein C8R44DRAFT_731306 [Mycena epipterygia]
MPKGCIMPYAEERHHTYDDEPPTPPPSPPASAHPDDDAAESHTLSSIPSPHTTTAYYNANMTPRKSASPSPQRALTELRTALDASHDAVTGWGGEFADERARGGVGFWG